MHHCSKPLGTLDTGNAAAEAIHVGGRLWPTFERKPCGRMRQRDSPAHHPLENGRRRAGHECERGLSAKAVETIEQARMG